MSARNRRRDESRLPPTKLCRPMKVSTLGGLDGWRRVPFLTYSPSPQAKSCTRRPPLTLRPCPSPYPERYWRCRCRAASRHRWLPLRLRDRGRCRAAIASPAPRQWLLAAYQFERRPNTRTICLTRDLAMHVRRERIERLTLRVDKHGPRLETDFAETFRPGVEGPGLADVRFVDADGVVLLALLPQPATIIAATGRASNAASFLIGPPESGCLR